MIDREISVTQQLSDSCPDFFVQYLCHYFDTRTHQLVLCLEHMHCSLYDVIKMIEETKRAPFTRQEVCQREGQRKTEEEKRGGEGIGKERRRERREGIGEKDRKECGEEKL